MTTRPYVVLDHETKKETLVTDATSQSHAIRVIIGERFSARPAKAAEMLKFINGSDIRSAKEEK